MEALNKVISKELAKMTTSPQLPSTISKNTAILPSDKFLESLGEGRLISQLSLVEVKQILTAFAAIMGIPANNMPTEEVMIATIQALVRNFSNMREGEIRKAFEMAATGQLDTVEHFQNLSLKYICTVLNAYRVKVNMAMRHYERSRQEPQSVPFEGEVDWSSTVNFLIEASTQQDPKSLIIPLDIYDWLISKGEIKPTADEKKACMKRAELELSHDLMNRMIAGKCSGEEKQWHELLKTSSYKKGDRLQTRLSLIAKRILVRDYLKSKTK